MTEDGGIRLQTFERTVDFDPRIRVIPFDWKTGLEDPPGLTHVCFQFRASPELIQAIGLDPEIDVGWSQITLQYILPSGPSLVQDWNAMENGVVVALDPDRHGTPTKIQIKMTRADPAEWERLGIERKGR